jgi:hypothetical protein
MSSAVMRALDRLAQLHLVAQQHDMPKILLFCCDRRSDVAALRLRRPHFADAQFGSGEEPR